MLPEKLDPSVIQQIREAELSKGILYTVYCIPFIDISHSKENPLFIQRIQDELAFPSGSVQE